MTPTTLPAPPPLTDVARQLLVYRDAEIDGRIRAWEAFLCKEEEFPLSLHPAWLQVLRRRPWTFRLLPGIEREHDADGDFCRWLLSILGCLAVI